MKIWDKELLDKYIIKHTDVKIALQQWIDMVEEAEWKSHNDLKKDFPSADYVGNSRYVFNIRGNNHRLVTVVVFVTGIFKIRFIGTHAEYDRVNCKLI